MIGLESQKSHFHFQTKFNNLIPWCKGPIIHLELIPLGLRSNFAIMLGINIFVVQIIIFELDALQKHGFLEGLQNLTLNIME